MGLFPRDNCPELFQSGVVPAAAHKNVTPFKARVEDGWPGLRGRDRGGMKKNISMPAFVCARAS